MAEDKQASMTVVATAPGVYGTLRETGSRFTVTRESKKDLDEFVKKASWMEPANSKAAKAAEAEAAEPDPEQG